MDTFLSYIRFYERTCTSSQRFSFIKVTLAERLTSNHHLEISFYGNLFTSMKKNFYVDAIRTVQSSHWCSGESTRAFSYKQHLPKLNKDSQQAKDIERFRWFSQDYLGYQKEKTCYRHSAILCFLIRSKLCGDWLLMKLLI